ncbi:MAG: metallophosphoesterase, partial [Pyrinomonadaceae bacterium]
PQWHREHRDVKIAVLTDLHVGSPHIDLAKLHSLVERTNRESPDLIVVLGDLVIHEVVGGSFVEPEAIAGALKELRATHGVVAVLGNHDWWLDGERVTKALRGSGITVLENEAVRFEQHGRAFRVAGIADLWTREPDIPRALGQTDESDPVILITHNPDLFPDVPARVSLTLAGHTHGGQVNFPVIGRPVVPSRFGQRYAFGHVVEGGRHLFVSGGVGTSILPVRFRVPPEIVVLTLGS